MRRLLTFYFDPRGRVSRKAFWLYYAVLGAVLRSVVELVDSIWQAIQTGSDVLLRLSAAAHFPTWSGLFELSANTPLTSTFVVLWLWPPFAISAKRLHDLGLHARWWLAAYVVAGVAAQLIAYFAGTAGFLIGADGSPVVAISVLGVMGAAGIIASLAIGLFAGQDEANQFGPDPLFDDPG